MATTTKGGSGGVRGIGLLVIVLGIIYIVLGAVTWGAVATNLAAEKITVSDDAKAFQGQLVDTPWEAWVQADIINHHALSATDNQTYAELPQDDPRRQTVMTASFLRASLFTSVVAFGVALLVVGTGITLFFVGLGLRRSGTQIAALSADATSGPAVAPAPAHAPAAAAPAPAHAPAAAAPVAASAPAPAPAAPPAAAPPARDPVAETRAATPTSTPPADPGARRVPDTFRTPGRGPDPAAEGPGAGGPDPVAGSAPRPQAQEPGGEPKPPTVP